MDTDIADVNDAKEVIHHYEWAITDGVNDARIIDKWSIVDITTTSEEKVYNTFNLFFIYRLPFLFKNSIRTILNNLQIQVCKI